MSKTRRNKKHKTRPLFDPFAAMRPIPAERIEQDMHRNYATLATMAAGNLATQDDWIALTDVVNTVEMLVEHGEIDGMHTATSQAAIAAMVSSARRNEETGRLHMTASELVAMREVLTLYHACLERKAWMVIYKAQKACTERINRQMADAARLARATVQSQHGQAT